MLAKLVKPWAAVAALFVLFGCPQPTPTPDPVPPPPVSDTVIDIMVIPGVTAPVTGATPVTTITETTQYTGTVSWSPVHATFAASTVYTATITLTPKAGFALIGVAANFFTVAGATSATNPVNSGEVTAVFPDTNAAVINFAAIPGVTAPVTGATPVTSITETAQYTGTVSWSPVHATFAGSTVYTATITLTPKAGFTLAGVAANFFTVAGATSDTNSANSGVVTAAFLATATVVNISTINGVTAPALADTPVTTIIETAQYTGTVSWSPSHATFAASTVYTATITLTAKSGYTLTGVAASFFTVADATSDTNSANSGVITAAFASTLFTLTMINVPAGRFQRDATATNVSVITLPYRMSQHEITREQFLAIMGTDPSNTTYSSGTTDPVQMTNWYHAIAFCNKLSIAEGLTPVYAVTGVNFTTLTYAAIPTGSNANWNNATATWTNNGYRLPTEMEWMWAAMGAPADGQGGGTNTTGYAKAFAGSTGSNAIGDYAWCENVTDGKSRPVGGKLPNELGLFDMSGNVYEWCWDWWATAYPAGTQTDYRGAASVTTRLLRGGSWGLNANYCAVAYRLSDSPYSQGASFGFRVVRN